MKGAYTCALHLPVASQKPSNHCLYLTSSLSSMDRFLVAVFDHSTRSGVTACATQCIINEMGVKYLYYRS